MKRKEKGRKGKDNIEKERNKKQWQEKKLGILVGPTDESRLTNLRFADDVMIVARTQRQLTQMLGDFRSSVANYGLEHGAMLLAHAPPSVQSGYGIASAVYNYMPWVKDVIRDTVDEARLQVDSGFKEIGKITDNVDKF